MKESDIVVEAGAYVRDLLAARLSEKYPYHTIAHIEETVEGCQILAGASHLGHLDFDTLLLAAWFHETGYIGDHEDHRNLLFSSVW